MEKKSPRCLKPPRTHFGMPEVAGRPSAPKLLPLWKERRQRRLSLELGLESGQNMKFWACEDGVLYGAPSEERADYASSLY